MTTVELVSATNDAWTTREPMFLCPGGYQDHVDECDCGFVGVWEYRVLFRWFDHPDARSDRMIRSDIKRGLPPRPRDTGWWVMAAFEERCPGCGDTEVRDLDGRIVLQTRNAEHADARIVSLNDLRTARECSNVAIRVRGGNHDE